MSFVHDEKDFPDLLSEVASAHKLSVGMAEKDYWVTHALWGLHEQGFDVWFKGGTSLSKGFGLIERFSEDLDLKIEPGRVKISPVSDWERDGKRVTAERERFFKDLVRALAIPGLKTEIDQATSHPNWRYVHIRAYYEGSYLEDLAPLKPYVLLEVGNARVTPYTERDITSFTHKELESRGLLTPFVDNRPRGVRCVHPLVTLIEKLDALQRRVPMTSCEPQTFVRHFEDAARIIEAENGLPPVGDEYADALSLALDMREQKQIAALPESVDGAFALPDGERTDSIRRAFQAIDSLYWGPRISLDDACQSIRDWLARLFP